jgi:hypothetical protein
MLRVAITVALGIGAGILAIIVAQMEWRFAGATIAGLVAAVGLLFLGSAERSARALIALLAFSLPVNVTSTLFLYVRAPDQFVPHVGGAAGFTVSITLLAALGFLVTQVVTAPERRIVAGFRIDRIAASGVGLFFLAGVLSLANAADWSLAGFELIRIATLFSVSVLVMNFDRCAIDFYLRFLAAAVIAQGLLASLQYASGSSLGLQAFGEQELLHEQLDYSDVARATGTLGNANFLAYFLELTLPMIFALLMAEKRRAFRSLYLAAFIAGLVGLLVTLSRGAWISLPFVLVIVFAAMAGRRIWSLKAATIGVVLAVGIAAAGIVSVPVVVKRVTADDAGSAQSRAPLNQAALSVIRQFPLLGVGLNNFGDAFPRYDQVGGARLLRGPNHVVHNMYLLIWGETGIVGLLAFLWYFGAAFCLAASVWRRTTEPLDRAIALGAALGLFAHMIHGLFDPGFRLNFPISTLIACQIGLLASVRMANGRGVAQLSLASALLAPVGQRT